LADGQISLTAIDPQVIAFNEPDGLDLFTMEGLVEEWTKGSNTFADNPPNAMLDGIHTHDNGTTSQCSIEVELMAAPEPGTDGQWTWQAIEVIPSASPSGSPRNRNAGCPDAAITTVVLSPTTIYIDSFSAGTKRVVELLSYRSRTQTGMRQFAARALQGERWGYPPNNRIKSKGRWVLPE